LAGVVMSASLPLSCGRRSARAFGASVALYRLAEATPEPSICAGVRPGGIDGAVAQIREICPRWLDERASSPIRLRPPVVE